MGIDDRMLDPDAVYRDAAGTSWLLATYDYSYVYLHDLQGQEVILPHADFNERVSDGRLMQVFKQPDLVFPKSGSLDSDAGE